MDEIGVSFQEQSRYLHHHKKKFREICGICVRLCSEAVVEHPWDLTLGVQSCEICGICVRLCSEAAVEHL